MLRLNQAGAVFYKQYWGKHPHGKVGATLCKVSLSRWAEFRLKSVEGSCHRSQSPEGEEWDLEAMSGQLSNFRLFFKFGCTES